MSRIKNNNNKRKSMDQYLTANRNSDCRQTTLTSQLKLTISTLTKKRKKRGNCNMAKVGMQNHSAIKKVAEEPTKRETWQKLQP